MSELATLIKCLPMLLGLIQAIRKGLDQAETNATVQDHLKIVTDAFNEKDASKLNALFNR